MGKTFLHAVHVLKAELRAGQSYRLEVDPALRKKSAINHTATHLLHAALRQVLGDRVKQAGSLVEPGRLRFDFTYPRAMTAEEIATVENLVQAEIWKNQRVSTEEMPFDTAIQRGALAFFDENTATRYAWCGLAPKIRQPSP